MSKTFKPISFEKFRVGKIIKSSKKKYTWTFELGGDSYTLDLFASRLSGKRTIILNGNKLSTQKTSGLGSTYSVSIPKHKVIIFEFGDTNYELRVNNISFKVPSGSEIDGSLKIPDDVHIRNKSSESERWKQENFGFEAADKKDIKMVKLRQSSPDPMPTPEKKKTRTPKDIPKIEVTAVEKKSKAAEIFNVFDDDPTPAISTSIPLDLFSTPLTSTIDNTKGFNPFEEPTRSEPAPQIIPQPIYREEVKQNQDLFNLVDLDGLHLGDNYSPAFAKRIEDANKPVSIHSANVPNVPMQNLVAQRDMKTQPVVMNQNMMMPNMMNPNMMNPNMINPNMANPNMMNPFMTGMMMGQWNGYYQNPNN